MPADIDTDALATVLYNSISLLARRLRRQPVPGALSVPERAALSRLDRGGPATAAELARAEQITAQAMGTTLAALRARGLVERRRDPGDGRRIIMSLTEDGTRTLRHKRAAHAAQMSGALAQFTPGERDALRAAAPLLERLGELL